MYKCKYVKGTADRPAGIIGTFSEDEFNAIYNGFLELKDVAKSKSIIAKIEDLKHCFEKPIDTDDQEDVVAIFLTFDELGDLIALLTYFSPTKGVNVFEKLFGCSQHVSIIAAVARNNIIGSDGQIPWNIKGEQKRFKELTMNNVVVMGMKTYESIMRLTDIDGKKEILPRRKKIVVTSHPDVISCDKNTIVASSLEEAINTARLMYPEKHVYLIGGAKIYSEGMKLVDKLYINEIKCEPEGDTVFPWIDPDVWEKIDIGSDNMAFDCFTYVRKKHEDNASDDITN